MSFTGFSGFKISQTKKAPLLPPKVAPTAPKVEFIETFDAATASKKIENEVKLVIPQSEEFLRSKPRKHLEARTKNEQNPPTNLSSADQLKDQAVRELIDGTKTPETDELQSKILTLAVNPDEAILEGAAEPTDEDFENIKIEDFGKALLRGMGWKDPVGEAKKAFEEDIINVRARGLGLGADKLIKRPEPAKSSDGSSELVIKRNARVKILAGKHKDSYGILESFENANRVTVKLAINSIRISINESIICAVTEREYSDKGKVMNLTKFDKYSKKNANGVNNDESKSSRDRDSDRRKDSNSSRRSRSPKSSSSSSSRHEQQRRDRHRSRSPARSSNSSSRLGERSRSREKSRNGNHSYNSRKN